MMADWSQLPDGGEVRARPTVFGREELDFIPEGHMLADTTAILGAIDVVFGECDR